MIDFVEQLLLAWGAAQVSPDIEVGIPSPLGQAGEAGTGLGGHRCLSLVETYAAEDRQTLVVEQALREISTTLGWHGRQMVLLAVHRYAQHPAITVDEQCRRLAMSKDVYRARLDRLHVEVAARWPGLNALLDQLSASLPAAQARLKWLAKVRHAARKAEAARNQLDAARRRKEQLRLQRHMIRCRDAVYRSSGWFQRSRSIQTGYAQLPDSGVFRRFTPCPLE